MAMRGKRDDQRIRSVDRAQSAFERRIPALRTATQINYHIDVMINLIARAPFLDLRSPRVDMMSVPNKSLIGGCLSRDNQSVAPPSPLLRAKGLVLNPSISKKHA